MTLFLPRKWCIYGRHEAPTDSFRILPGVTPKRTVCADCFAKIMAARERVKIGEFDANGLPF